MSDKAKPVAAASPVHLPKIRRGLKGFYREVMREMKQVHWPSRQEAMRLTGIVLAVCVLTVVYLYVLSEGFGLFYRAISPR